MTSSNVAIDMHKISTTATSSRPTISPLEIEPAPKMSRGIVALTVETPTSSSRPKENISPRPPARWKTPEFIFYAVVFVLVVPLLFKVPMGLSEDSHPNYWRYKNRLSDGWLFGRKVDNSDSQYRGFRDNVPALLGLSIAHLALSKAYAVWTSRQPVPFSNSKVLFSLTFSVLMIFGLHGLSAIKIILILVINYLIAKTLRGQVIAPPTIWAFNLAVLFLNEINDGYRFASIHPSFEHLDRIQGFYPRWHITFNICVLRLISFSMDYHWACNSPPPGDEFEPKSERERAATRHPLGIYNLTNYLAYALYPPLYIAGPIITFNNFMWQMRHPLRVSTKSVLQYLVRFLFCFFTMEFVLHYMYVVAIKDSRAWEGNTPAEISMVGFWNLIIVWLKLLIPWRFFRLWALSDGLDPPENMVRCMANNYSPLGFWRSWHRSYNLWTVRYIYIPVGGSKQPILSTVLVFTFVALWHDLSMRLLMWGWLVTLFILPELLLRQLLPASKFSSEPWYRHACAVGGVCNILMMMVANLVGFVVGMDGIKHLLGELIGSWKGLQFLTFTCICIFIAVQVMFEYREEEMRRGVFRRC